MQACTRMYAQTKPAPRQYAIGEVEGERETERRGQINGNEPLTLPVDAPPSLMYIPTIAFDDQAITRQGSSVPLT
jgi:hypothetical protein